MITAQSSPQVTTGTIGRPTKIVRQRICSQITVRRHDQMPGNVVSHSAEVEHALVVGLHSVVLGFIYIRNDGTSFYEDGSIRNLFVPSRLRSKILKDLRIQPRTPRASGTISRLPSSPLVKLVRDGYSLTSCY